MRFRTTIVQSGKNTTGIQVPDEVVEALGNTRPSTAQSRQLWRAYFGR